MSRPAFAKVKMQGAPAAESSNLKFTCKTCKKTYKSMAKLNEHLKSREHLKNKAERGDTMSVATGASRMSRISRVSTVPIAKPVPPPVGDGTDSDDSEQRAPPALTSRNCLFCSVLSDDFQSNLAHMKEVHGFKVPCEELCTDLEGFVSYLARKVSGTLCLVCGVQTKHFSSIAAVQDHMRSAGHQYVKWTGNQEEYSEYFTKYDLSSDPAERLETLPDGNLVLEDGRTVWHHQSLPSTSQFSLSRQARPTYVSALSIEYRPPAVGRPASGAHPDNRVINRTPAAALHPMSRAQLGSLQKKDWHGAHQQLHRAENRRAEFRKQRVEVRNATTFCHNQPMHHGHMV